MKYQLSVFWGGFGLKFCGSGKNVLCAAIYFTLGTAAGIVLFYGTGAAAEFSAKLSPVTPILFARLVWNDILWLLSVYMAGIMFPFYGAHPVLAVRGVVNGYSLSCMLKSSGVKYAAAAAIPQCLSILPMLLVLSAHTHVRRKYLTEQNKDPSVMRKSETLTIFAYAISTAAVETLFYTLFCKILF